MSALLRVIVKTVITLLGGLGAGAVLDKVAADKLPSYQSSTSDLIPGKSGFNAAKLGYLAVAFVLGAVALRFIGRKMNIKVLK